MGDEREKKYYDKNKLEKNGLLLTLGLLMWRVKKKRKEAKSKATDKINLICYKIVGLLDILWLACKKKEIKKISKPSKKDTEKNIKHEEKQEK